MSGWNQSLSRSSRRSRVVLTTSWTTGQNAPNQYSSPDDQRNPFLHQANNSRSQIHRDLVEDSRGMRPFLQTRRIYLQVGRLHWCSSRRRSLVCAPPRPRAPAGGCARRGSRAPSAETTAHSQGYLSIAKSRHPRPGRQETDLKSRLLPSETRAADLTLGGVRTLPSKPFHRGALPRPGCRPHRPGAPPLPEC